MTTTTATPGDIPAAPRAPLFQPGRMFVGPVFDTMLIGGGLSLIVGLMMIGFRLLETDPSVRGWLTVFILLSNSAHFAASTVRLYTKPGATRDLPFLTFAFPVITLAVLAVFIIWADHIGRHLMALYLTWSPYHYAAQAYGLAVMYGYRSGCKFSLAEKRLLRAVCMLPFLWALVNGANSGLGWFVPPEVYADYPWLGLIRRFTLFALAGLTMVAPAALFWRLRAGGTTLPLISLLLVFTNGIWWIIYPYGEAFLWATVFHGIQYLAIVAIFHVKDQVRRPGNRRGWKWHAASFYAMCLALGYFLFYVWPHAWALMGFGWVQSAAMVVAVVNLHHFIVDGYIWKIKKDPGNRRVVQSGARA